jgi:hypothetical protein
MNRLAGIVLAAVGLIIAVLGVAKVVPGITSTGVILVILGILFIGLSFVKKARSGRRGANVDCVHHRQYFCFAR